MSDAAKHTLRTAIQTLVGLLVLLPSATASSGFSGLVQQLPWAAGAVAVAGAASRAMALPGVQALLPGWLRTEVPANGDRALLDLPDPAPAPASAQDAGAATPSPAGFGFTVGSGSGSDPAPAPAPGAAPGPGSDGQGGGA
jgi:hypothetical protein